MKVGDWVQRVYFGIDIRPNGKWHFVESVIAGAAITKCGRRLEPTLKDPRAGLDVSDVMPLTRLIGQPQLCHGGCSRE